MNEKIMAAITSRPSTRNRYPDEALKILSSFMIYDIIMISQRYYNKSFESRKTEKKFTFGSCMSVTQTGNVISGSRHTQLPNMLSHSLIVYCLSAVRFQSWK